MKKISFSATLLLLFTTTFSQQNIGLGTNSPTTKLDVQGGIALREGTALSLITGANNNISLTGNFSFYRITGPTAAFTITGLVPAAGADGQVVTLINTTANVMTIVNNAGSNATNQITTLTGADLVSAAGSSSVTLQYNKTATKWYVTGTENFSGVTTSITSSAPLTTNTASTGAVTVNLTGTVPVANGGTGLNSTPANGQIDIGNGSGFTRTTVTGAGGISVTNGAGSITLTGSGGTVTSITAGTGLTGGTINGSGTIGLSSPVSVANGGTGSTTAAGALANIGAVGGSGTTNTIPKFTSGSTLGNSSVTDNGTTVTTTEALGSGAHTITAGATQAALTINGTSNPEILLDNNGAVKLEIGIPTSTGDYIVNSTVNDVTVRQTGGQKILFSTSTSGATNDLTLSGGNVGVGTTSPSVPLEVTTTSSPAEVRIGVSASGFGQGQLSFVSNKANVGGTEWRPGYISSADGNPTGSYTGRLDFYTNGTGSANAYGSVYAMSIYNGKVGIGTTAPNVSLTNSNVNILGSDGNGLNSTSMAWVTATNGYTEGLYNSSTTTGSDGLAVKIAGTTSNNKILDLSTGSTAAGSATSVMVVRGDGNVGINNASPGHSLDVTGDIHASGSNTTGFTVGSNGATFQGDQGGSLELGGNNSTSSPGNLPYIDFHYGNNTVQDFNARIINDLDGQLDILGTTLKMNGNLTATGTVTTGLGSGLVQSTAGVLSIAPGTTYQTPVTAGTGITLAGSQINSYWTFNASNLYNNNAGNIGIGTTSPQVALDVTGAEFIRDNGTLASATSGLKMAASGGANYIESAGTAMGNATAADLNFTNMNAASTWMTIKASGNVGIGATGPLAKLEINNTANQATLSVGDVSGVDDATTYGMVNLTRPADATRAHLAFIRTGNYVWQMGFAQNTNTFGIFNWNFSGTQGVPVMAFTTGNNVGINNVAPAYSLDINSSFQVSSTTHTPSVVTGGGSVTTSGGFTYISYILPGNFTFTTSGAITAEILIVAGGGGGGNNGGGGGGGGGVLDQTSVSLNGIYSLSVGSGGLGASFTTPGSTGSNGSNSTFGSFTAVGGGGGASRSSGVAVSGGSGGGGSSSGSNTSGASGTSGQGTAGGNATTGSCNAAGGGGGGAGAVGGNSSSTFGGTGGAGGTHSNFANFGVSGVFGGGGGGGVTCAPGTLGNGGSGGGGAGSVSGSGTAGSPNTGGGGGGGGNINSGFNGSGANGANGIVVIRYANSPTVASSQPTIIATTGGNVGIGTNSPTANLQVAGTFQTSQLVTTTYNNAATGSGHFQVTVSCGTGGTIISGGCYDNGDDLAGSSGNTALESNYPINSTTWRCQSRDIGTGQTRTLTAYAVCTQ